MNDFYVTLPSNVKSFEDNTVTNFKTKLASRLEFKGDWDVGLASMSYTLSWYNLPRKEYIKIRYFDGGTQVLASQIPIYPGRYDKIQDLLEIIQYQTKRFKEKEKITINLPEFKLHEKTRLLYCIFGVHKNRLVFPEMSEYLSHLLGFNKKELDAFVGTKLLEYETELNDIEVTKRPTWYPTEIPGQKLTHFNAQDPFELSGGYHSLFVYCDIVRPSYVGDSFTQLLRFVEIPQGYSYGDQIVLTYPDTHYLPVMTKEFETIEIDIKDDTGQRIPFEFGRTIIVLHFRKRS